MIVIHADLYAGRVHIDLDAVLNAINVRLRLIVEPALVEATMVDLGRASVTPSRLDWVAFEQSWRARSGPERKPSERTPKPVTSNRAQAASLRRIEAAAARRRDVPYLDGFCQIANESGRFRAYVSEARGTPMSVRQAKREVTAHLRGLAEVYPDPPCFAQAIRGSMVALRGLGWIVTLDDRVLAAAPSRKVEPRAVDTERLARIRTLRDTKVAAAATLVVVRLSIEEIADLKIEDIDEDGSVVRSLNDCELVPAELRPILRAQRISRVRTGAPPNHRFLAGGARTLNSRHAALSVRMGLGLAKVSQQWREVLGAPGRDERWLGERGITIRRLKYERARNAARLEADKLSDEAIEALRARASGPVGRPCLCPRTHVKPRLLKETHGRNRRGRPQAMTHPWRVR